MATVWVWIAEFSTYRIEPRPFATLPSIQKSVLEIGDGEPHESVAFHKQTQYIRIISERACAVFLKVPGSDPAPLPDVIVPAMQPELFGVPAGASVIITMV